MKIIEKFLNFLRIHSIEGIENNFRITKVQESIIPASDSFRSTRHEQTLYVDKYFSDSRHTEVDRKKTIIFNGRNFGIPEVQLCAALLLKFSKNGKELMKNKDYPSYYEYKYGLMNIGKLHLWLYKNGYLRKAVLSEVLGTYKVKELKIMLDNIGLIKTGNKPILIKRISDNIDNNTKKMLLNGCQKLFLTEKGYNFLDENYDYVLYHGKQYGVQFSEFQNNRILQGEKRNFHDTIFKVLSEKAFVYQSKQWLSQLGWVYSNLSDCLYDEKRYDLALQNTIYVLYFNANMASLTWMFDIEHIRNNNIKHMTDEIKQQNIFSDWIISRIINLQDYFNEQMVDIVYSGNILPYCLFRRNECVDFVYDLIENDINFNYYIGVIKNNYEKYIKQYL